MAQRTHAHVTYMYNVTVERELALSTSSVDPEVTRLRESPPDSARSASIQEYEPKKEKKKKKIGKLRGKSK